MKQVLSKEEVARLTDEQKEAYAKVVLADGRARRILESRAGGYRGSSAVPLVLGVIALALAVWTPSLEIIVIIGLLAVVLAMQWQSHDLNRRLDAVLELLMDLEKRCREPEAEGGSTPAQKQVPGSRSGD